MMRTAARLLLMLWIGLAPPWSGAGDLVSVPTLTARVTDLTGTLTSAEATQLESELAAFESRKGSQIALLIVPTTQPETIEAYGIRVAEAWKVGRKGVDDGVLLIVAKNDRRLRIEVGYGLEGAVTDATAHRIILETIAPRLRENDFFGGLHAGIAQLMRVIDGEPLPAPAQSESGGIPADVFPFYMMTLLIAIFGGFILRGFIGRLPAGLLAGAVAALATWFVEGTLLNTVLVAFVLLVGVALAGGGAGRASSGRSSSGSYSGGGGRFGGGGSSGGW